MHIIFHFEERWQRVAGSAEFAPFKLCGFSARVMVIIVFVSRLRRLVLSGHFFFVTCRLLAKRHVLSQVEFACLARVVHERRQEHGFLLTAWVFLPDHWHAILFPRHPLTISEAMESIEVSSTKRINRPRGELGLLGEGRFFDRALRTVKEYPETVEYIPMNPVRGGLVNPNSSLGV